MSRSARHEECKAAIRYKLKVNTVAVPPVPLMHNDAAAHSSTKPHGANPKPGASIGKEVDARTVSY